VRYRGPAKSAVEVTDSFSGNLNAHDDLLYNTAKGLDDNRDGDFTQFGVKLEY
jgi:hypothetical protein